MEPDDELRTLAHREITAASLPQIRTATAELAENAGLGSKRAEQFAFAVHEVATNTVDHAAGTVSSLSSRMTRPRCTPMSLITVPALASCPATGRLRTPYEGVDCGSAVR
jgi:anti-sigma regulatory factor (Ser/Thr protein kinase)